MADGARDGFSHYFAEKLWESIPPHYRELDGEGQPPGALRAFVEVIAEQAAILRRSQDRVWEDQFVERADDWAVPYLGDLVATRMVSALLPRERRIDVAKTVYYRRRAGTLRVLEELIADIANWEGVVCEGFRRLARAPHGLDPPSTAAGSRPGRWSGTPAGGLADLRHPFAAQLAGGPFDEYHHTPELRQPRGRDGQYGISRIVFHCFRLQSRLIEGVTPRAFAPAGGDPFFTFDPSGRDVPLFARRTRSQTLAEDVAPTTSPLFGVSTFPSAWEAWTSARPWEIPAAIKCRLLGDVAYQFDPNRLAEVHSGLLTVAEKEALVRLYGLRVRSEARLAALLSPGTSPLASSLEAIRAATLAADCGKAVLLGSERWSIRILPDGRRPPDERSALPVAALQADDLSPAAVTWATWQQAAIDAERGRFVLAPTVSAPDLLTDHHGGFPGLLGAGVHERGQVPWVDPDWTATLAPSVLVSGGGTIPVGPTTGTGIIAIEDSRTYTAAADNLSASALLVSATDGRRPYLRIPQDWRFRADADGTLALDGLWIGAEGAARDVVLEGDWERVEVRCCTLDPGGRAADGSELFAVGLRIEGTVERLVIQSSIVSRIDVASGGIVDRIDVRDSVLQSATPIDVEDGELHVERTTVFGDVSAWRLWASDSLFAGLVQVVDVQNGCFRFSAAHLDSQQQVPHPYQSAFFTDATSLFVSTTFGDPSFAVLSAAPEITLFSSADDRDGLVSIHEGAENDGEMGVWCALLYPVKQRALRAKVDEFLPFGLLPVFVNEV